MLHYTDHALERMEERGISKSEVEMCISSPQITFSDETDEDCINYVSSLSGRVIRVVVKNKSQNHQIVITAIEQGV